MRADDNQPLWGAGSEPVDLSGVLVQAGMHLATYFASEPGRLRIAIPFLREGLSSGQPCFLIASGEVLDRYLEALEKDVKPELAEARRRGLFITAPTPGRTVDEALGFWNARIWATLSHGSRPPIVRIVGDMACVKTSFATVPEMLVFERLVGAVMKSFPVVAVCQYDVREFDGPSLLEAIQAHPDVSDLGLDKFITS
ncbi:MAG TPA: MEDS domain-containing protein [Candidatus Dormibacteraeota bacterium]|jgi:transcriptional repressor of dcmA and dcmR